MLLLTRDADAIPIIGITGRERMLSGDIAASAVVHAASASEAASEAKACNFMDCGLQQE